MSLQPLADFGLLPTCSVTVLSPNQTGTDALGEPVYGKPSKGVVDGVLVQLGDTDELGAERPNGERVDVTFFFPKGYEGSLSGCTIVYEGDDYRVLGDPQELPWAPGPFSLKAEAEAVYG